MFNPVSGLKVDGGFFKAPSPFMLFQYIKGKKQKNVAVIDGKNGTGKISSFQIQSPRSVWSVSPHPLRKMKKQMPYLQK